MRLLALTLVACPALVALAACGGGGRVPDEEFEEEAVRLAEMVLLTNDDFPAVWSGSPSDDDDEDDESSDEDLEGLSEECRGLIEVFEDADGGALAEAVIDEESETFSDGDENEIASSVGIYRDRDDLDAGWAVLQDFVDECGDDFNEFFKTLVQEEVENDPDAAGLVSDLEADFEFEPVDGLGDRAIRLGGDMSFTTIGIPLRIDFSFTWIQVGRLVVGIDVTDFSSLDDDLVDELTELTIERARTADEELPR